MSAPACIGGLRAAIDAGANAAYTRGFSHGPVEPFFGVNGLFDAKSGRRRGRGGRSFNGCRLPPGALSGGLSVG